MPLSLNIAALNIPFKTSFKHASADRKVGESIWVEAQRNGLVGRGEGCPRMYVTGEDVHSGIEWLQHIQERVEGECTSLTHLLDWAILHRSQIDAHPAAWCAVELALLDLFACEKETSVEALLGLNAPQKKYFYTAVLGNSAPDVFKKRVVMYLKSGFNDFKVKLEGDIEADTFKLSHLINEYAEQGDKTLRIRLDANNLWTGNTSAAILYIQKLNVPILGIEEPVEPANSQALSEISLRLNTSSILDESLCKNEQLSMYSELPGKFIANIKVSRVGGVLRALEIIKTLKLLGWPIIVGAHVGETSILTRAAMCVAQAAGDLLIAQEGAFGIRLLEYDKVFPCLMFGQEGCVDLSAYSILQADGSKKSFDGSYWSRGWGFGLS